MTAPRVKPFTPDPAVLRNIRAMRYLDAERVAQLHHAAMGNSLWARLGLPFLTELYRGMVDNPLFFGFVYEEAGRVRGFIAGSSDAEAMMGQLFKRRFLTLGAAASLGVLRRPGVLRKLAQTARYFQASDDSDLVVPAESLFCSFEPELRGKRVSGHINKVLFDELLARGETHVKITTETDNTGANRQLTSWGFERRGEFDFYGKRMVRYVLDLTASERVDPVSRHPSV
jgi:ribosomal protein S18 acetylase RimI-like enzyme